MIPQRQHLTTILLGTLTAGFALAQMPGGGVTGGGTKTNMMGGQQGAQMMGGQMMKSEMMGGMVGTLNQMHQLMEQLAGTMGHDLNMKQMGQVAKMMDDMSGMMKTMAVQCREGKMDAAQLKIMNQRLETMKKIMGPATL